MKTGYPPPCPASAGRHPFCGAPTGVDGAAAIGRLFPHPLPAPHEAGFLIALGGGAVSLPRRMSACLAVTDLLLLPQQIATQSGLDDRQAELCCPLHRCSCGVTRHAPMPTSGETRPHLWRGSDEGGSSGGWGAARTKGRIRHQLATAGVVGGIHLLRIAASTAGHHPVAAAQRPPKPCPPRSRGCWSHDGTQTVRGGWALGRRWACSPRTDCPIRTRRGGHYRFQKIGCTVVL